MKKPRHLCDAENDITSVREEHLRSAFATSLVAKLNGFQGFNGQGFVLRAVPESIVMWKGTRSGMNMAV